MSIDSPRDLLRRSEVATWLNVPVGTLAQWASTGKGPRCFRLSGKHVRYMREDVEAFIADARKTFLGGV